MKIIVAGTGYVGLVQAAVCSEYGHQVYAYDNNVEKIKSYASGDAAEIEKHVNEPGLSNLIKDMLGKYLFFSSDIETIIEGTDVIFLCLPTPPNLDGSTNLTFYDAAASELAALLAKRKDKRRVVLVNKSTVPIGTARHLENIMKDHGVENVGVASNPEFLADYGSNTMLLTYFSFWNGVGARLGEKIDNIRIADLRRGVTADDRISTWGSYVSNGAGGSCFGKDIQSLIYQLRRVDVNTKMLESSYEVNEYQKVYLIDRAITESDFSFSGKTIAVLGLAFKKQTNDMRDSSSIKVIETLLGKGVKRIKAYDPLAITEARKEFSPSKNILFEKIEYFHNAQDAIEETDAVFISADWEEFRGLSGTIENTVKPPYLVIDGRRMIPDFQELVNAGYSYIAVGSPAMLPEEKEAKTSKKSSSSEEKGVTA